MLRQIILMALISSCSFGVVKSGGDRAFVYDPKFEYSSKELVALVPEMVETSQRDPKLGKLSELFPPKILPIKRIGIFVFETLIQPTYGGLAAQDLVYLNEAGKQILTEKFLSVWEESFPLLATEIEYISTEEIKKNKYFDQYGISVDDYVKTQRQELAPDDIFYLPSGKKTTTKSILNARGMRDHGLILIPAAELMQGPKFSEHAKHAVNELARDLKLDALLIVISKIDWTGAHVNKHSGEHIPEQLNVKLETTTIVPMNKYHERLSLAGIKGEQPSMSIAYRFYEAGITSPVTLSVPEVDKNFDTIQQALLSPMLKIYKDMTQVLINKISFDIKQTH